MSTFLRTEWTWTKGVQERPWAFSCDIKGCYWNTAHKTYFDAEDTRISHECPYGGGNLEKGKSLLDEIWDRLDELIDVIKEGEALSELEMAVAKAEAKGIASVIAILCNRHYTDTQAVSREASRRYKLRKGLLDGPPSSHEIAPRGVADNWKLENKPGRRSVEGATVRAWVPGSETVQAKSVRKFSDKEIDMIKGMKKAGLPLDSIARSVKAAVSEIRGI